MRLLKLLVSEFRVFFFLTLKESCVPLRDELKCFFLAHNL